MEPAAHNLPLLQLFDILRAEGIADLTARDGVRLEKLLASRTDWDIQLLAQSAAALLATDAGSWQRIHDRILVLLSEPESRPIRDQAPGEDGERPAPVVSRPLQAPSSVPALSERTRKRRRIQARIAEALGRIRGLAWAVILAVLAMALLVPWLVIPDSQPVEQVAVKFPPEPEPEQSIPGSAVTVPDDPTAPEKISHLEDPRGFEVVRIEHREFDTTPKLTWLSIGLIALCLFLLLLGARWLAAPRLQQRQREHTVADQRRERAHLATTDTGAGVAYHIKREPPFAAGAIDDVATVLSRLIAGGGGGALDIGETLDRTIRAAGRLSVAYRPIRTTAAIIALVDIERGDHPFLDSVDHVLHSWQKTGLRIVRYHYRHQPSVLRPADGGPPVTLEIFARQRAGAPLILFTRLARPANFKGRTGWLRRLAPWPARVLIDLDPRQDSERAREARAALDACASAGLSCHPFTPAGLMSAARVLAGQPTAPPDKPALQPADAIEPHLRLWASLAAYVPDPTWRQLESLRRAFPELHQVLDQPGYAQRLIDWLYQQPAESDPMAQVGRVDIDFDLGVQLIGELRERADGEDLEERARRLLLKQLSGATPDSEYQRQLRTLKMAFHEAMLDPERISELVERFAGSAHEQEMSVMLAQERRIRVEYAGGQKPLTAAARDAMASVFARGLAVPLTELLWPRWHRPGRRLLVGIGLAVVVSCVLALYAVRQSSLSVSVPAHVPYTWTLVTEDRERPFGSVDDAPTGKVLEGEYVALENTAVPMRFVRLSGGEFTMGPRRVRLSSFWIAEHEVTQAQWRLVVEGLEQDEQARGEALDSRPSFCKYGCGEDLPVQNVSWYDAARFMNALSRREKLTPCYTPDDRPETWVSECDGYRFPTEAEWEYAARAGSTATYSFGDDESKLGEYAWYDENSGNEVHSVTSKKPNRWGLWHMHGNVWEWVWDWYGSYREEPEKNPIGPKSGDERLLRGGSFFSEARLLRSALRDGSRPSDRLGDFGFRCVRGSPPASTH